MPIFRIDGVSPTLTGIPGRSSISVPVLREFADERTQPARLGEPRRHLPDDRRIVDVIDRRKPHATRDITAIEIEAESAAQGGIDRLLRNELAGERELDDFARLIRVRCRDDAVTVCYKQ